MIHLAFTRTHTCTCITLGSGFKQFNGCLHNNITNCSFMYYYFFKDFSQCTSFRIPPRAQILARDHRSNNLESTLL